MDPNTVHRLIDLNRQFYQTFALQFSATRQRLQPGAWRILQHVPLTARILDLGCGNGELWRVLSRRGFMGDYVGLDFTPELLEVARKALPDENTFRPSAPRAVFIQADLSDPGWDDLVLNNAQSPGERRSHNAAEYPSIYTPPFDFILAFSVLHHLPGSALRRGVLEKIHSLLEPEGRFIHSEWQFLNSPRLRARIQPWETIGLTGADVDPGDYLLDWRQGGSGLRYVHHFSQDELNSLALVTGFRSIETFYSDGEGGNLGLYQVWGEREP